MGFVNESRLLVLVNSEFGLALGWKVYRHGVLDIIKKCYTSFYHDQHVGI
jgi:hypothetical protein